MAKIQKYKPPDFTIFKQNVLVSEKWASFQLLFFFPFLYTLHYREFFSFSNYVLLEKFF